MPDTKHIEVDYHFIRKKVVNKDISTRYLSTLDQIPDIFTKGLTTSRFLFLRDKLSVCSPLISLRGDVRTHAPAVLPALSLPITTDQAAILASPNCTATDQAAKESAVFIIKTRQQRKVQLLV
ncbi:hypothetical protein SLA2020_337900 [Shorea laevis]